MAIAEYSYGTFSPGATSTTWTDLDADNADDGVYQIFFDIGALAAGDVVELRVEERALSGGTDRVCWVASAANVQAEAMIVSPSLILLHNWTLGARQTTGTVRSFPWSVRRIS